MLPSFTFSRPCSGRGWKPYELLNKESNETALNKYGQTIWTSCHHCSKCSGSKCWHKHGGITEQVLASALWTMFTDTNHWLNQQAQSKCSAEQWREKPSSRMHSWSIPAAFVFSNTLGIENSSRDFKNKKMWHFSNFISNKDWYNCRLGCPRGNHSAQFGCPILISVVCDNATTINFEPWVWWPNG